MLSNLTVLLRGLLGGVWCEWDLLSWEGTEWDQQPLESENINAWRKNRKDSCNPIFSINISIPTTFIVHNTVATIHLKFKLSLSSGEIPPFAAYIGCTNKSKLIFSGHLFYEKRQSCSRLLQHGRGNLCSWGWDPRPGLTGGMRVQPQGTLLRSLYSPSQEKAATKAASAKPENSF